MTGMTGSACEFADGSAGCNDYRSNAGLVDFVPGFGLMPGIWDRGQDFDSGYSVTIPSGSMLDLSGVGRSPARDPGYDVSNIEDSYSFWDLPWGEVGLQVGLTILPIAMLQPELLGLSFELSAVDAGVAANAGRASVEAAEAESTVFRIANGTSREYAIRGNGYWGGTFSSTRNAAGGQVITSEGGIAQADFSGIVDAGRYWGQEVKVISGVHADAAGVATRDLSLLADDVAKFGHLPGVTVYDYFEELAAGRLGALLNSEGRIIAGFCNSEACLGHLILR